jgi:hypothetical protein
MAKGRASWRGLVGLYQPYPTALSLLGLVVVALLPDRSGGSPGQEGAGPRGGEAGAW